MANERLLLLDAGGVLVGSYTSKRIATEIANRSGRDPEESWDYFRQELYHSVWTGEQSEDWLWAQWLAWAELDASAADTWSAWAKTQVVTLPETSKKVQLLATQGPVWVLSNHCGPWLRAGLETGDVIKHLDRVFVSSEIGVRKPFDSAYEIVLSAWANHPETIIYVDDKQEYLDPAASMGFQTVLADEATGDWFQTAYEFLSG